MSVMAPTGRKLRPRAWGLALIGIVAIVLALTFTTWSASADYGGVDADGHWIDNAGNPVTSAPPTVQVEGTWRP